MLEVFVLHHPQSRRLVKPSCFKHRLVRQRGIACGTTQVPAADLSEANDFYPTRASWNSILFEASVIMTVWEHADDLIGDRPVAFLHSDIEPHFPRAQLWRYLNQSLAEAPARPIGLVAPSNFMGLWNDWLIPSEVQFIPKLDPMWLHCFDNGVYVWEFIKLYDPDLFEWAVATQPRLIYSHQFACSRLTFDALGAYLTKLASRLRLADTGFWTPHMFERLIALFLARHAANHGQEPLLTTAFWHHSSSGVFGPGAYSLYGPRPFRFYQIKPRNCG